MFKRLAIWTKCPSAFFATGSTRLDLHILFDVTLGFVANGAVQNNRLPKEFGARCAKGLWQYLGKGETVQNLHERTHGVRKLALQGARTRKHAMY